jgi:hypothetical protein
LRTLILMMIWAGFAASAGVRADFTADTESVAPPVAGQPMNFNGAIGSHFSVRMRAAPTELLAEDPLLLTVTISGKGNVQGIRRPDLRRLSSFRRRFHIDDLAERYLPATKTREFDYRLRPRTEAVKEIPPLPFVFFNPEILPPEKGYQTTLSPAIPLSVRPRAEVRPARVEGAVPAPSFPASVYQLVEGETVLRHDLPFSLPGPYALAALLIGPPALGGIWYLIWQRCYPDALRQARKCRSRAAQHALKALQRSRRLDAELRAQQVEAILAGYLRQRHDLVTAEPTPGEILGHLERCGVSAALARDVASFFSHCDAARFAPGLLDGQNHWTATATRLVLALEEEAWSSLRS